MQFYLISQTKQNKTFCPPQKAQIFAFALRVKKLYCAKFAACANTDPDSNIS